MLNHPWQEKRNTPNRWWSQDTSTSHVETSCDVLWTGTFYQLNTTYSDSHYIWHTLQPHITIEFCMPPKKITIHPKQSVNKNSGHSTKRQEKSKIPPFLEWCCLQTPPDIVGVATGSYVVITAITHRGYSCLYMAEILWWMPAINSKSWSILLSNLSYLVSGIVKENSKITFPQKREYFRGLKSAGKSGTWIPYLSRKNMEPVVTVGSSLFFPSHFGAAVL